MVVPAAEEYYNEFYRELSLLDARGNDFSKIADLLTSELDDGRRARVADIGCGHGSVSGVLVDRGHAVYGVEIGDAALHTLVGRGIYPIKGDIAERLPIADRTMNVVLLLDVLEHVFSPLWVLGEAHRILRPGGTVVVTVPLYFDLLDRLRLLFTGSILSYDNLAYGRVIARRFRSYNYDHIRFFRPKDVDEMLAIAGFTIVQRVFGPIPSPRALGPLRHPLALFARLLPGLFAHSVKLKATKA